MASMPTIYISPGGGEGISHASRHPPPSGGPALTGWRDTLTFKGAYSESRTAPAHARTTRTDCRPRLSRSCSLPPSCCLGRCLGCRLGHCKQGARSARTCVLALILLLRALPHMPSHAPCMCTYSPPRVRLSLVRRPQAAATGRRLRLCQHRRRRSSLVLDAGGGVALAGVATSGGTRQQPWHTAAAAAAAAAAEPYSRDAS